MNNGVKCVARRACVALVLCMGCSSGHRPATMSAAQEAHYRKAIAQQDQERPPLLQLGQSVAIDLTGDLASIEALPAERSFEVSPQAYHAFFAQSPALLLAKMKLEPVMDGTSLVGYRIAAPAQPFEHVDLKAGDILLALDGSRVYSPDDYYRAWQKAKASTACSVTVQRGAEQFSLSWRVLPEN